MRFKATALIFALALQPLGMSGRSPRNPSRSMWMQAIRKQHRKPHCAFNSSF